MKKSISLIITLLFILTFSACSIQGKKDKLKETSSTASKKINVTVSFNAMKEFTEAIGGDKVKVETVVPSGTEPHDFEPKAKDMENITKSKVFIYNGLGMETWVEKTLSTLNNKELIVVDTSKGCNLIENKSGEEIKEHGKFDPHIWLSLKEAQNQSKNIKEALVKADPENKTYYENNYNSFIKQLDSLYNEYSEKFKEVKNKNFVTGHAAFAYLCRDFGLKQNSVENIFGEGEPTAKKIKELVNYCNENNVKTIFSEEMASPKVSETLAKEVGGKVEKIYTIENKEEGKDYIQSMRGNLEKIFNSLK